MYLEDQTLNELIAEQTKDTLHSLGSAVVNSAYQATRPLIQGLVRLEKDKKSGKLSGPEVRREYRILRYEYELRFLKNDRIPPHVVDEIVSSTFGAIRKTVNDAMGFDLIDENEGSSGAYSF